MPRKIVIQATLLTLFIALSNPAWAIIHDKAVQNFTRMDYRAASQNWAVSRGTDGMMFFANHNGLLEFDGTNWQLHRLPNETILRSVYAVTNDSIYTSGYRELGYWVRDKLGRLQYHSLTAKAQNYIEDNDEFWNISVIDQKVYFHAFTRLLVYQNDSIKRIGLAAFTNTMQNINGNLFLAERDMGIYKISGNTVSPFLKTDFFTGKTVRFILSLDDKTILIGTASNGIFAFDGKDLKEWLPTWTNYFKEKELNRGYISPEGDFIFGTILDGIVVFDASGNFKKKYNTENGLQNNTVLGISTDQFNNIWLALDRGVSVISSSEMAGIEIESIPNVGAVYTAAIYNDQLYLGTNQGLFHRKLNSPQAPFELVPETQSQIWDIKVIDNQLLVGHNQGTFLITPTESKFITRHSGGFSIRQDTQNPNLLIQSTYSNLIVFEKKDGEYQYRNYIANFNDLIRYLEIDHYGNIWASHMHRGVYKMLLDDSRRKVVSREYFGENSLFGKDHSLHVFNVENRIVFTTKEKLYTYVDINDTIIPYDFLNQHLGKYKIAHRIIQAPNHHYWFITNDSFALFKIQNDSVELIRTYPNLIFESNPPIDEYENIYPITDTKAIVCLENGIAWLDASVVDENPTINYYHPKLREIQLSNNKDKMIFTLPTNKFLRVKNPYNNLRFKFSFPHYTNEPIYYQSYLQGISQQWSEKTTNPVFRFDRLPPGMYELKVKAVDIWGSESQEQLLSIEILPPWYKSLVARVVFILFTLSLLILFRAWGVRKIKRKEQLEHDRREKELVELRNEKLNSEVAYKSKELANSTMAIIKKNEFLMDLKAAVTDQKEQLGSRYPDKYYTNLINKIDKNIDSHDDWSIFETNFERAHEQFLKKLKEDYPDLTNKDLRLCAYIRMNLSSKEIAPLLGISVRGVENHRYRLRKKMGMDHDDNLIDFIMKY
ncbi:helix-turn-helix and ligand-binding sensor domain-containing protein [Mangrovibacterium diazotrophicum]|uniref:DNA-binding CsgD family transcriptional regulator n=1 Tax=Mangrovibacterium diazotrophicum TaxID=1261403 RepID=A0A419W6B5_9BACT|nr:triple tyrosine motif-containing protein [Mangrovibacterium diazotrophicum]RKD90999.1 DNA-binding CsgD family transcriptional regulator [Mangrovibacterium diazotrophicum]